MFSRLSTVFLYVLFTLTAFVAATSPVTTTVTVTATAPGSTVTTVSQCNTGDLQCCNSVESASSSGVADLLGLLGIVLGDITGLVGITCSPLSIIGLGSSSCTAEPVCCENNTFNGLISLGCSPITL
ncbi:hypothetical protein SERLA73DRAFT_179079 [Serpula lacrymans var. lacrymans S7.3]|uniref:Hydrophobin n=2 Tax=Serpula lacrymans var. lacrymans TaxID=341189 RepID=F8PTP4_SERL3|nr:hydrophobin [Serpula lacrymans var. lacrymans S7.9]EGO01039.1 hypothetical protein SERLA73DRAFT_179079 [Serpula lacrymans var. lacrymans S7.3]EGO27029.1 hydrophobin [Serpula lacrymans var. lacrymans S7.9]